MRREKKLKNIPGWEIVSKGLQDISNGKKNTINALAVFIASPRLNDMGFCVDNDPKNHNLMLYKKLGKIYDNDAHYQYNALMKRVEKFCRYYPSTLTE